MYDRDAKIKILYYKLNKLEKAFDMLQNKPVYLAAKEEKKTVTKIDDVADISFTADLDPGEDYNQMCGKGHCSRNQAKDVKEDDWFLKTGINLKKYLDPRTNTKTLD